MTFGRSGDLRIRGATLEITSCPTARASSHMTCESRPAVPGFSTKRLAAARQWPFTARAAPKQTLRSSLTAVKIGGMFSEPSRFSSSASVST